MQDFSEYLNFTKQIAFDSGKILSKYFGNIKTINQKSTSIDLVTNADLESELSISLEEYLNEDANKRDDSVTVVN